MEEDERRIQACLKTCAWLDTEVMEKHGFSLVPIIGEELTKLSRQAGVLAELAEYFSSFVYVPERNCSCHTGCAPCSDCEHHAYDREMLSILESVLKERKNDSTY